MAKEDEIRLIAYNIWEQEGCQNGHDCEHWLTAESIWEVQQKQKTTQKSSETGSKKIIPQNPMVTKAKKKS